MNVTSVTSQSNGGFTPLSGNNQIKLLEKQQADLQEQIQKTANSKMDQETKRQKIKELQDQLQQIASQIQQLRSEKLQPKNQDNDGAAAAKPADAQEGTGLPDMTSFLQATATYSQAQVIQKAKTGLHGKGNVLEMEIKLDEGRGGAIPSKKAELEKIRSQERSLPDKMGDAFKKTNEALAKTSEDNSAAHTGNKKDSATEESREDTDAAKQPEAADTPYKPIDIYA